MQNVNHKPHPRWSPRLKHRDLTIYDNCLKRTDTASISAAVCCLIDIRTHRLFKWALRVNFHAGMAVGVCQQFQATSHKFEKGDWVKYTKHRHYCVFSNGFVVSNKDTAINMKHKSFRFKTGDTLEFKLDYAKSSIKVTKD